MPTTQPSREKVRCGYPGCEVKCERRVLKRHYSRKHPNHPIMIKNDGFGQSGRWNSWVQPKHGGDGTASSNEDDPSPGAHSVDATSEGTAPCEPSTDAASTSQQGDQDVPRKDCSQTSRVPDGVPHSQGGGMSHSDLGRLTEDVASIKRSTAQLLQLAQQPPTASASHSEARGDRGGLPPAPNAIDLIPSVRSVHALELLTDSEICAYPSARAVVCTTCVPDFNPDVHMAKRETGVFGYDFSVGTRFESAEFLPPAFSRLKTSVKEHLKGREHQREKAARLSAAQTAEMRAAAAGKVNIRLGRTAYFVLKTSMPRERYEELIVLQHINGLDMGRTGHSSTQIARFRAATHEVLVEQLREHIASQPCVALMADKVTVNHRTIDITAVMSVVPAAPAGQLIQTYVIGAPVVIRHDGKSMAEQWRDTVASVGIKSTEQLSAVCTDGQYLHNHVPANFLRLLGSSAGRPAVPCLWDGAHLLQLAESGARNEPGSAWVRETIDSITRISKRFRLGAGLEQLRAEAEDRGVVMRSPQLWSETRFAPHAANVLEGFRGNLALMEGVLERQLPFCSSESAANEIAADLRDLKASVFRLRLAALQDIYALLSRLSKNVQDVQKLPWERQQTLTEAAKVLIQMARALSDKTAKPGPARQGQQLDVAGIRQQLQEERVDFGEVWPNLSDVPALMSKQADEIGTFCRALANHCEQRDHGVDRRGNRHGSDNAKLSGRMEDVRLVGDLLQLRSARFVYVTVDIANASERLQRSGLVPTACSMESVKTCFNELRSDACKGMTTNQELLKHLLLHQTAATKPYLDLVIRIWLISPPESVVESMASAVKEVFGMHRQLTHANAAMELAIRWNGPDLCSADQLIGAVVAKLQLGRATSSGASALLAGKVIRRHLGNVCARSRAFFRGASQKAVRYVQKKM